MNVSQTFSLVCCLVLLLFCCAFPLQAAEGTLKITEMAVTTKIAKGNPIDSVRRISSTSVNALYCFTRIVNPEGSETVVKHVWYKDEKPVSEQELKVTGQKWRTWSKRQIDPESVGDWRVDAYDSGGKLLKSVKFRIN